MYVCIFTVTSITCSTSDSVLSCCRVSTFLQASVNCSITSLWSVFCVLSVSCGKAVEMAHSVANILYLPSVLIAQPEVPSTALVGAVGKDSTH